MADSMIARRNFLALKQKSYAIKFDLEGTDYTPIENIGTGAYGVVCSAINIKTKKKVAIKKIPSIFEQRTIAKRTYREIKILKHFKHDNVIAIQEILHPRISLDQFKDIYIVLDLMETDLHRIIHSHQELTEEHVRFFTYQILRGLKYVHSANVVHRDLKPSNLLVNENCALKIGDFGMARGISNNMDEYSMVMTQYVATRWYRAPELMILPKETYTEAVDMWSVGCILAEMIGRKQLFPGKSHVDQIEKIIDKLGTPSAEYLKLTSSPIITGIIMNKGHVKAVNWKDIYPKANKDSLDLLNRMLILDPKKRITVNQALDHTFLKKYHDPIDEPICVPIFNFDFERESPNTQQLKDAIVEEIMEFHKPKPKPKKMQFNFRSVPQSELSPPANKFNFKSVPKSELEASEKRRKAKDNVPKQTNDSTKLPSTFLPENKEDYPKLQGEVKEPINLGGDLRTRQASQSSSDGSKSDGSFERKHSKLVEELLNFQALQENVFTGTDGQAAFFQGKTAPASEFKKPEGYPLSVKVKDTNSKASVITIKSSSDVEMQSANASAKAMERSQDMCVETKPGESLDIEMPSAKNSSVIEKDSKENTVPAEPPGEIQKPLDTKELIRKALLNTERRKQKEAVASKPKPVTALQRQREREEKRRQKLEKAKQKHKKTKQKSPSLELTDEDKKLLEKWKNMQTKPSKQDEISENVSSVTAMVKQGVPETGITDSKKDDNSTQASVDKTTILLGQGAIGTQLPAHAVATHTQTLTQNPGETKPSDSHSTVPQVAVTHTGINPAAPNIHQQNINTAQNSFQTGFQHDVSQQQDIRQNPAQLPFGTYNWSNSNVPQVVTEMSPAFSVDGSPSKLPTYMEAVGSKPITKDVPWSTAVSGANSTNTATTIPSEQVPFSDGQHVSQPDWLLSGISGGGGPNDPVLPEPSFAERQALKADHDMRVITRQLQQSNVEDLVLVNTPKGTGGGYGVASDFDLFMEIVGSEGILNKPDSAQLSPSLFTDWQELTGNLDQREFETVLQEYMTSPISSQELNTVMLSLMSPKSSNKVS